MRKLLLIVEINLIRAVFRKRCRRFRKIVSDQQAADLLRDFPGKLPRLSEQFQRHGMHGGADHFRHDGNPLPLRLVRAGGGVVLDIFKDAVALFAADAAHAAGGVD